MTFGFTDPRLSTAKMQPGWMQPGPVAPVQLTPGFRAPGAGGGMPMGMPQQPQMGGGMPTMPFGMLARPNMNPANKPPGMPEPNQYGVMDPEAVNSAYPGDPATMGQGGSFARWLKGLF